MGKSNTYKLDPLEILGYANAYAAAADTLQAELVKDPPKPDESYKWAPVLTVDSFAAELYLKCLHAMDYGTSSYGHPLKGIFKKLKDGTQKAIRFQYNFDIENDDVLQWFRPQHPEIDAFSLDKFLDRASQTFERVRYQFEHKEWEGPEWFYWSIFRKSLSKTANQSLVDRHSSESE